MMSIARLDLLPFSVLCAVTVGCTPTGPQIVEQPARWEAFDVEGDRVVTVAVAGRSGTATMIVLPRGLLNETVVSFDLAANLDQQGALVATGESGEHSLRLWMKIDEPQHSASSAVMTLSFIGVPEKTLRWRLEAISGRGYFEKVAALRDCANRSTGQGAIKCEEARP